MPTPKITKLEVIVFEFQLADLGTDYNGFNLCLREGKYFDTEARRIPVAHQLRCSRGVLGQSN